MEVDEIAPRNILFSEDNILKTSNGTHTQTLEPNTNGGFDQSAPFG